MSDPIRRPVNTTAPTATLDAFHLACPGLTVADALLAGLDAAIRHAGGTPPAHPAANRGTNGARASAARKRGMS